MKLFSTLGIILVLTSTVAMAQEKPEDMKATIQALYDKSLTALKNKDLEGHVSLYADDFEGLQPNHVPLTKVMIRATASDMIKLGKFPNTMLTVTSIDIQGSEAVSWTTETIVNEAVTREGKKVSRSLVSKYKDTFVKTDAGWKLKVREPADIKPAE